MAEEEELVNKLSGLVRELDYCCHCDQKQACPDHAGKTRRQWRDIPPPRQRKVPFEVDWQTYPLVTGLPVLETRYKANMREVASEPPRVSVQYEPRTWLPKPVDLGGDGTPWDLRRYRSRELIASQLHFGCVCPKRNGLQDECRRLDCKGKDCCTSQPVAKCRPSGGPGVCELPIRRTHKSNCWCDMCRPPCCATGRMTPRTPKPEGVCPECLCLQSVQCGSTCAHYCDKHMLGATAKPCPPILY
ncbi:uncharacterized protein LOC117648571 [Thrips palmi]|uniref:Uncharacterized protein LOC117648571 n=1 Tax=Thrips palmi TaxID=161013 RepID=A0A6P8ZR53_THRPL|nr:uncharacterized protein LOC117648571 [Thrips palmi]